MNALQALIYANIVIWLGFGAYALFMAKKQTTMDKRLQMLIAEAQDNA